MMLKTDDKNKGAERKKPSTPAALLGNFSLTLKMIRYNLKIIFGNRFLYFLISAVVLFLFIVGFNLFNGEMITEAGVYRILLLVGALLLFYPVAFGIQSDKDARILEIIFGVPDYRYRVWFLRILLIFAVTFVIQILLSLFLKYVFVSFSILALNLQVLFPLAFLGFFTFFLSTFLRTGNATAAVVIILGIVLLILFENIENSYWNIFFNPYGVPSDVSERVWHSLLVKNRIFLFSGTVVFLLGGLMNLQNREKFLA